VNGLVWVRGPKEEYDAIEALGSPGWNWDNFYAAMRKVICGWTCFLNITEGPFQGRKFSRYPCGTVWVRDPAAITRS
jgi:hypothetical protein